MEDRCLCLNVTGQMGKGDIVDLDFDHQFISSGKKDAKYSYKKADGYFPGVAAVGNLILGIEKNACSSLELEMKFLQKMFTLRK